MNCLWIVLYLKIWGNFFLPADSAATLINTGVQVPQFKKSYRVPQASDFT